VKSVIWNQSTDRYRVHLHSKDARNNNRFQYIEEGIDFFILYCLGVNVINIVPFSICSNNDYANLYPHRTKLQQKGFNC